MHLRALPHFLTNHTLTRFDLSHPVYQAFPPFHPTSFDGFPFRYFRPCREKQISAKHSWKYGSASLSRDFSRLEEKSCTIFVGNQACDLDSMVSALSFSYLNALSSEDDETLCVPLLPIKKEEFPLRTEASFIFEAVGITPDDLLFLDEFDVDLVRFFLDSLSPHRRNWIIGSSLSSLTTILLLRLSQDI